MIRLFLPRDDNYGSRGYVSQSFGDMAFSPKGVIWVLSIFERTRLSRYCAVIRERNSCLYRICKKNIFCSKYMINIHTKVKAKTNYFNESVIVCYK